jgi:hypothetical protein
MPALSPEQARLVVKEVREEHGLGQKYALEVEPMGPARWKITDAQGRSHRVEAMGRAEFRRWLEQLFVEPIAEHDATMEG